MNKPIFFHGDYIRGNEVVECSHVGIKLGGATLYLGWDMRDQCFHIRGLHDKGTGQLVIEPQVANAIRIKVL